MTSGERHQAYKGVATEYNTTHQAISETSGQILSYQGGVVESLYAATQAIVDKAHKGAGMSQNGAYAYASQGYDYQQHALSGLAPYAMGKMAQIGLMNVLAAEGKEHGILVNAISPVAKTRIWNVQDEPEDLRPEQVAPGVLYLASPECRESGFILRASNSQFTTVRWVERENVDYPLNLASVEVSAAEDLVTRWQDIAAPVAF